MKLRSTGLINTLILGLLAWLLTTEEQQPEKVYRIGYQSAAGGRGQRFLKEGLVELG